MKRGTPRHPKTLLLAAILEIPRYAAVGLLESLWHFAQGYAQTGDIGKYADEVIAEAVGWEGNAAALVSALAQAGWIDRCQCHRARIHDWPIHCDQTVKRWLTDNKKGFERCYDDASTVLVQSQPPSRAVPSLAEPSQAKPHREAAAPPEVVVFDHWREVAGHPDAKFTAKRKRAVRERLREGYTVEQLRSAVDGCRASPFHQGANERHMVYDDLELICRSGEKVEQFIGFTGNGTGLARADPPLPLSSLTEHNARALGLEGKH